MQDKGLFARRGDGNRSFEVGEQGLLHGVHDAAAWKEVEWKGGRGAYGPERHDRLVDDAQQLVERFVVRSFGAEIGGVIVAEIASKIAGDGRVVTEAKDGYLTLAKQERRSPTRSGRSRI